MEKGAMLKFYSMKPTSQLIEQLRSHRIKGNTLDKEWYEALKIHLSEREISAEERETVDHILSDDFIEELETTKKHNIEFKKELKRQNYSSLVINPNKIIDAGKAIKGAVYVILGMMIFAIISVLVASVFKDKDSIKNIYILLGVVSLISNIIILSKLYSAGDDLVKSVEVNL